MCLVNFKTVSPSCPTTNVGYKVFVESDEDAFVSPLYGTELFTPGVEYKDRLDNYNKTLPYPYGFHIYTDLEGAKNYLQSWKRQDSLSPFVIFEVEYLDIVVMGLDNDAYPVVVARNLRLVKKVD